MSLSNLAIARRIQAARRHIQSGECAHARDELDQVPAEFQSTPPVLKLRWQIAIRERSREGALSIAQTLVKTDPESPVSWIALSISLTAVRRHSEAIQELLRGAEQVHPCDRAFLVYEMAMIQCRQRRLNSARKLLGIAFDADPSLKLRALEDHNLRPLWDQFATPIIH